MRIRGKIGTALAGAAAVGVLVLGAGALPAHAANPGSVAAQGGSGYRLNDWGGGGNGNAVKMYTAGVQNNNFQWIDVKSCNGSDIISSACAGAWGGSWAIGAQTIEIQYNNSPSLCVGTNGSGYTVLAACGDQFGNGAGNGTIMATFGIQNCNAVGKAGLVDRYWSVRNSAKAWLLSGGAVGNQALYSTTDNSCWGNNSGL